MVSYDNLKRVCKNWRIGIFRNRSWPPPLLKIFKMPIPVWKYLLCQVFNTSFGIFNGTVKSKKKIPVQNNQNPQISVLGKIFAKQKTKLAFLPITRFFHQSWIQDHYGEFSLKVEKLKNSLSRRTLPENGLIR